MRVRWVSVEFKEEKEEEKGRGFHLVLLLYWTDGEWLGIWTLVRRFETTPANGDRLFSQFPFPCHGMPCSRVYSPAFAYISPSSVHSFPIAQWTCQHNNINGVPEYTWHAEEPGLGFRVYECAIRIGRSSVPQRIQERTTNDWNYTHLFA